MAELFKNKLCICANELIIYNEKRRVGSEKGFVPEGTFQTWKKKKYVTVVRRASPGFSALVVFDSMRRDIRDRYIEIYGDPHDLLRVPGILEATIQPDEKAITFFNTWTYGTAKENTLKPEAKAKYILQAQVLNALIWLRDNKRRNAIGGGGTRINVWKNLSNLCNQLGEVKEGKRLLYPHDLPENHSALKRKTAEYETEGYRCLINKNHGNLSATLLKEEGQQAIIHKLLSHHNNLDNEQIRTMYNAVAEKKEWKLINSTTTVENWRKKFGPETEAGRKGIVEFRNTMTKQIKRSAPKKPLTYWSIDGWTAELLYRKTGKDKNQHKVTTYHHRLTIVFVLDTCTKYPIGYAIGEAENVDLIKEAMKNAVNHTRELFGARYKARQVQTDNYGKGALKPFYEACCEQYTPARVHNAKAKVVEPYNNYFNNKWCKLFDNFSGYGITSNKDNQPNQDYINGNKKNIPDREGCMEQLLWCVDQERKKKIGKYMEAYQLVEEADKLPFPDEEYLLTFGQSNGWTHSIGGSQLEISVNGQPYHYEYFDQSITYHFHERWLVRYDPDDMSRVLVTNARGDKANKFVEEIGSVKYLLQARHIPAMALHDQTPEDFTYRAQVEQDNKQLEQHILGKMEQATLLAAAELATIPELGNNKILERMCIADSRGQHKNQRNALREIAADAEYVEVAVKPPRPEPEKVNLRKREPEEEAIFDVTSFLRGVRAG